MEGSMYAYAGRNCCIMGSSTLFIYVTDTQLVRSRLFPSDRMNSEKTIDKNPQVGIVYWSPLFNTCWYVGDLHFMLGVNWDGWCSVSKGMHQQSTVK